MLTGSGRETLLEVARASVHRGVETGSAPMVRAADHPEELWPVRATFVTLTLDGRLRGCIGTLEARLPLVEDVALHAFGAAFQDPRFPAVTAAELERLDYHVSILTPNVAMDIRDEADLVAQLRPGVDGLVIERDGHRATFLPSVWESLPDPRDFLAQLKLKAGIRHDGSGSLRAWRYETESFGADATA